MTDPKPGRQSFRDSSGDWDDVTVEAPLKMIVGTWQAVTLRTPGADEDLVRGLLLSEGLIDDPARIQSIHVHPDPGLGAGGQDRVEVRLDGPLLKKVDRAFEIRPSCGLCGQDGIDDSRLALGRSNQAASWQPEALGAYFEQLRNTQPVFSSTGACHAAGLIDSTGTLVAVAEDIGRHNAVDKVIGSMASDLPVLGQCLLLLSGRSGYELVAKAIRVGIPAIASVGGTSSAAINLAKQANLGLAAFCRNGQSRIYQDNGRYS